jgi:5-methylcytosine-specific restriction protein A
LVGQIEKLIATRRKTGIPDLKDNDLAEANIEEMRQLAYLCASPFGKKIKRAVTHRARSLRIHAYILRRANGQCEGCKARAPFLKPDRTAYLEPHHTTRLADDGPDHPATIIALCPNCHRRSHYGEDSKTFNRSLINRLAKIEPKRSIRK